MNITFTLGHCTNYERQAYFQDTVYIHIEQKRKGFVQMIIGTKQLARLVKMNG